MPDFTEWALGSGYLAYPQTNRTATEFALALAAVCGGHMLTHYVFLYGTSFYGKMTPKKNVEVTSATMSPQVLFAQTVNCMVWSAVFFSFYAVGLNEVAWSPEARWKGRSEWIEWGLLFHCAYSVYEESIYIYFGKPLEMHIHHFVVLYNFLLTLCCGQMQFWAAWDGTVEVTNIPLSLLQICQTMGVPVPTLVGVMLFVTFLVFRVVGMGCWLYFFYFDVVHCDWSAVPGLLIWGVVPSTLFLWVLSNMWFYKITRGMLKMLGLLGDGKGKKEGKKAE
eukprot:g1921.t1